MLVQGMIRKYGLNVLKESPYFIDVKEYDSGLVTLNYNQIESPKLDPMVGECRGLILDSKNNWNVVARSFNRFFNYGECPKTKDYCLCDGIVFDKIDGSLMTVYWHDGKWNVSTRKMAYAEGETSFGTTFRQVFDKCFDVNKISEEYKDLNFVFEMVSPETRVVTPYSEYKVYLLTVTHTRQDIQHELEFEDIVMFADILKVSRPSSYRLTSFEEVIKMSKELPAMEEGYVCCWESGHRVKIKNPAYLAIAHLRNNGQLSEKRVATLVMSGDEEEYLTYFKEDRPLFQPYIDAFKKLNVVIHETWELVKHIENQKEYAMKVKDLPISGIMFQLKKGLTLEAIYDKMSDEYKADLLLKYKEK